MTVRDATPEDLVEIGELIRALADYEHLAHEVVWTLDELGQQLFGDDAVARVAIAEAPAVGGGGAVVAGFALWFPTFSTFLGRPGIWLEDLFVRPEHRGQGHGVALLTHLQALASPGRLEWAVLDWNEASIAFYEAMGARPVDGWTRYRWLAEEATSS